MSTPFPSGVKPRYDARKRGETPMPEEAAPQQVKIQVEGSKGNGEKKAAA